MLKRVFLDQECFSDKLLRKVYPLMALVTRCPGKSFSKRLFSETSLLDLYNKGSRDVLGKRDVFLCFRKEKTLFRKPLGTGSGCQVSDNAGEKRRGKETFVQKRRVSKGSGTEPNWR